VKLLVLTLVLFARIFVGGASQYDPGVMDDTIALRQSWGEIPLDLSEFDGAVAVPECSDIGQELWCRPVGTRTWEHFIAVDCGSKTDSRESDGLSGWEWMVTKNVLIEMGHDTAVRWDCVGQSIQVECTYAPPYGTHPKIDVP